MPKDCIHQPPNIAADTPRAPRDKFNPPVKITTIIANPTIISIEATLDKAYKLNLDENPSVTTEKKIEKKITKHNKPNWLVYINLGNLFI